MINFLRENRFTLKKLVITRASASRRKRCLCRTHPSSHTKKVQPLSLYISGGTPHPFPYITTIIPKILANYHNGFQPNIQVFEFINSNIRKV
jgi:hypothetical protein